MAVSWPYVHTALSMHGDRVLSSFSRFWAMLAQGGGEDLGTQHILFPSFKHQGWLLTLNPVPESTRVAKSPMAYGLSSSMCIPSSFSSFKLPFIFPLQGLFLAGVFLITTDDFTGEGPGPHPVSG